MRSKPQRLYCVAGRSVFLDGGLHFVRLDAMTGKKLAEEIYDDKDPETGRSLQERHKTLQILDRLARLQVRLCGYS